MQLSGGIDRFNAVLNALKDMEDDMIAFAKSQERVIRLTEGVNASQRAVDLALMQ